MSIKWGNPELAGTTYSLQRMAAAAYSPGDNSSPPPPGGYGSGLDHACILHMVSLGVCIFMLFKSLYAKIISGGGGEQ